MRLDFIKGVDLSEIRAIGKREALIEGFAMQRSINLLWSPAGSGKTSLMFALAKALAKKGQEVAFIDADNGIDLLQDRNYDKLIEKIGAHLKYINADTFDDPKREMMGVLDEIKKNAKSNSYEGCVFIFDSLKFFLNGGIYDEEKIERFISFCKAIRRNGGMVWVLNHSTKKRDTMKGGQSLIDAVDECWEMKVLIESMQSHNYICEPEKKRMNVKRVGFSVDKQTYELTALDIEIAEMTQEERDNVEKITKALKEKRLTQGEIITNLLGKTKDDKTTLKWLEKHTGRFWNVKKEGKEKLYTTVTTVQLSAQNA
jgi:tRNA uridine 5-carbamoylmethylation protein Kti12